MRSVKLHAALFSWLMLAMVLLVEEVTAQEDAAVGAFIVVSKEGDVEVLDVDGQALPAEDSAAGKTLLEGQTIKTEEAGKIILLLSTGTLTIIEEQSKFILEKFRQKPFEQEPDQTVGELAAEPSNSDVKLKLGYGSVVFNVKKLNPGSSFEIESPIGSAGIRGTDGQLEVRVNPDTGNFTGGVNMLSGSVNFRTVDGLSYNVPAGQAVLSQVSPTGQRVGQVQEKPVPPPVSQKLSQKTNVAKDSSKDVKVGKMNQARQEADQKIKAKPRKQEDKKEEKPKEEKKNEEEKREESKDTKPEDKPEKKPEERQQEEPKETTRAEKIRKVKTAVEKKLGGEETNKENQEQLLEVDDQADLAQQGVVVDRDDARKLKSLGLEQDDLKQLSKVSQEERKELLQSDNLEEVKERVQERVIQEKAEEEIQTFSDEDKVILQSLPEAIRNRLLTELDANVTKNLLQMGYSAEELADILNDLSHSEIVDLMPSTVVPEFEPDAAGSDITVPDEFRTLLSENDNIDLLQSLLTMGEGELTESLIQLGRETNEILSDVNPVQTLDSDRILAFTQLQDNPFYGEPVSLAESFFAGTNLSSVRTYASRNLTLSTGLNLSEIYQVQQKARFMITAEQAIHFEGEVELSTGDVPQDTYLSLLAGDAITFASDTHISFTGDHLHLGAWGSMEMVNVSMESGSSLEVTTLEDIVMRNSSLIVRGGDEIHLQAAMDLQLNGVNFSNNLREIYMQATTIDLRNINFPAGSIVNMATQFGGIDGKYPTFPTGDPQNILGNREIGRVNFIQNVQYNQNLLNNRLQFNQFGQNIHITTIQP